LDETPVIRICAMDPGLATFGLVHVDTDGARHIVHGVDVFTSENDTSKTDVAAADDRVRRVRELHRWLDIHLEGVDAVAAEAMSFPRGASAIACICLAWGALTSELERRRLPLVTAQPRRWRQTLAASGNEHDAHVAALRIVPGFVPYIIRIDPRLQLHALDAAGVFCWSLTTSVVRATLGGCHE
jgi:Holliday junction resolvasome RuvABC endonuclease subunit